MHSPFGQNFTVEFDPFSPKIFGQAYCTNGRVVLERALTSSRHDISPQCLARKLALHSWRHDQLMMTLIILTLHNQSTVLCSAWKRSKTNTRDPFVEIFGLIHKYYDQLNRFYLLLLGSNIWIQELQNLLKRKLTKKQTKLIKTLTFLISYPQQSSLS